MEHLVNQKKSNLTRNIFIALLLGIAVGFYVNTSYVKDENQKISFFTQKVIAVNNQLKQYVPDTTSAGYKNIKKEIAVLDKQKSELESNLHTGNFNEKFSKSILLKDSIAKLESKIFTLAKDTNTTVYKDLKSVKSFSETQISTVTKERDKKIQWFSILADIFLRLIKMIVAPLVFTTLVVGIAKLGDIRTVGRIGGKTLLWFVCASWISLFLGMLLVNLFKPGKSMNLPLPLENQETGLAKVTPNVADFISHIFPKSFIEAMASNEILQIVVFSIFFGIAAASLGKSVKKIIKALDLISHIILKITGYVMNFAPIAVFGAMAAIISKQGLGILKTYTLFITEFYFGLLVLWIVLLGAGFIFLRSKVFHLFKRIKDPILIAFSTSSSEAAFPKTMLELERFGCSNKITSFVLPLGYSFNLDGSMMYMTFASIFIAQSYGINLSIETQFTMLIVLMLTSKGIAGVPRASLVVIAGTLASFKIPEVGIALLLGIDPLLDMGRSATNVVGNSIATAVVSKFEKEI